MTEPSDAQKAYAKKLSISYPPEITAEGLSDLISEATGAHHRLPATPAQKSQARQYQIPFTEPITRDQIEALLFPISRIRRWILSVQRHVLRAPWVFHSEAMFPEERLRHLTILLLRDKRVVRYISDEAEDGLPDRAIDSAMYDRGIENPDEWFFFDTESGPTTTSKAFRLTADLLREGSK